MELGAILFADEAVTTPEYSEEGNLAEILTVNKRVPQDLLEGKSQRPVIMDQKELPELTAAQMH